MSGPFSTLKPEPFSYELTKSYFLDALEVSGWDFEKLLLAAANIQVKPFHVHLKQLNNGKAMFIVVGDLLYKEKILSFKLTYSHADAQKPMHPIRRMFNNNRFTERELLLAGLAEDDVIEILLAFSAAGYAAGKKGVVLDEKW